MLLSLNNSNVKLEGTHIHYGSTYEDIVQLNKGDKIALKRFHFKLAAPDRSIFQSSLGLKRFKLFIKYYDNVQLNGFKEELLHTFTYNIDDDSYTFEADKDNLTFQECSFDESRIDSLKIYGICEDTTEHRYHTQHLKVVPILLKPDSTFELDWVIQKAGST